MMSLASPVSGRAGARRRLVPSRGRNTNEVSTMSDFDRNSAAARWGRTTTDRAGTAVIDQGLRAYMLHIYNYMALALAITGFAALGTFMLSVTDDKSLAAATLANGMMLTSFGQAVFLSPLKWVVMLLP